MTISAIRVAIPTAHVAPRGPIGEAATERPEHPVPPRPDTGVDPEPRNEGPLCGVPEHPPVYI